MKTRCLLATFVAFFGWTGWAHAQAALGQPVAREIRGNALECDPVCKPRPALPIFGNLARRMLTPMRSAWMPPMQVAASESVPTKDEVARMILDGTYSPAEITAAKIKIDEAQGKSRIAAVRFLGTVDCHYYPEAEAGLIAALRADRVESVRHEAVLAIGNCRGATPRMFEALNLTAMGSDADGNPAETSERIRAAARNLMNHRLYLGMGAPPAPSAMMPYAEWWMPDPGFLHTTSLMIPTYASLPTQQERDLAQSVSTNSPTALAQGNPRTVAELLHGFRASPDSRPPLRSPNKKVDPRLRGLSPLGSDAGLAIPNVQPFAANHAQLPPYNRE